MCRCLALASPPRMLRHSTARLKSRSAAVQLPNILLSTFNYPILSAESARASVLSLATLEPPAEECVSMASLADDMAIQCLRSNFQMYLCKNIADLGVGNDLRGTGTISAPRP